MLAKELNTIMEMRQHNLWWVNYYQKERYHLYFEDDTCVVKNMVPCNTWIEP